MLQLRQTADQAPCAKSLFAPATRSGSARQSVLGQERRVTLLTSEAETEGGHDVADFVLATGAATPLHLHRRYEERLWVVSGSLTV
ncbi:hypothetical protein SAMN05216489_09924 [Streptomyces sp. 3213]|nr:hypothetical protein SAMN05216489_09924 [Streptomyces sp. 3213] [Streptomyces sp. 3213.3]